MCTNQSVLYDPLQEAHFQSGLIGVAAFLQQQVTGRLHRARSGGRPAVDLLSAPRVLLV
jgi:hypothetical protein